MANYFQSAGIFKKMTGDQRRCLLEQQAARLGKDPNVLLEHRKQNKIKWQAQRKHLEFTQCCNCGHKGHNFDFCPFSLPFFLNQSRFRGKTGLWRPNETAVVLTEKERLKSIKHFEILSMPVPKVKINNWGFFIFVQDQIYHQFTVEEPTSFTIALMSKCVLKFVGITFASMGRRCSSPPAVGQ